MMRKHMALTGILIILIVNGAALGKVFYNQSQPPLSVLVAGKQELQPFYAQQSQVTLSFSYPDEQHGLSQALLKDLPEICSERCDIDAWGLFEIEHTKTKTHQQSRLHPKALGESAANLRQRYPENQYALWPVEVHLQAANAEPRGYMRLKHNRLYLSNIHREQFLKCETPEVEIKLGVLAVPWISQVTCRN